MQEWIDDAEQSVEEKPRTYRNKAHKDSRKYAAASFA